MQKLNKIIFATLLALALVPRGFVFAQFYTTLDNPQTATAVIPNPDTYVIAFALTIIIFFIAFWVTLKS
jgi:hypothetical protein